MMKRLLVLFAVLCSVMTLSVQAEKGGYFAADYPFADLKRVEVHVQFAPELVNQELYAPLLHEFPAQVTDKLRAKGFATDAPLIPVTAEAAAPTAAQAILDVRIHRVETFPVMTAGYVDWRPYVTYLPIRDKDGDVVGYEPYVDYIPYNTPARRELQHLIGITYTLYDAADGREISRYSYLRTGTHTPATLARKTAGDYASRLAKVCRGR